MVTGDQLDVAAWTRRRDSERIALALHDEHGDGDRGQLGQAALGGVIAAARRVQREGEAQRGVGLRSRGRAAGHAGARGAPADDQAPGQRLTQAGAPARAQLRDHRQPGLVELGRRGGRAPAGHPVGLFDEHDRVALAHRRPGRRDEVGCADPAAGAVTEHQRTARRVHGMDVSAGEAARGVEFDLGHGREANPVRMGRLAAMSALLLYGDTVRQPALRHELPLAIIDPLLLADLDGRVSVLTSTLERDRIGRARPDVQLLDFDDFDFRGLINAGHSYHEAGRLTAVRAVQELGVRHAVVPGDFPLGLGDALRAAGVAVDVDDDAVQDRRRRKAPAELDGIRAAQHAAEAGMAAAAQLLGQARPGPDGRLRHDGRELRAEDVRAVIRDACARAGAPCPPDIMVGSVWQGYGHEPGHGPLPAGLPIVIDLWPCHEASACWADMTRTFIVGEPARQAARVIAEREELVRAALDQARAAIRPGVRGRDLHDATCDLFEAAGYATQRTACGEQTEGFQFSLGHGVGLEVHEAPSLGLAGHEPLVAGDVLALEPGLYDGIVGGVRLEDLVLVTPDGCQTLTDYSYDLVP